MRPGIKLETETVGSGPEATHGDVVSVAYELYLNRGELVQCVDDLTFTLGRRQVIAALEYGVEGMCAGGHRCFRAGPQLGYRDQGVDGKIPPNAILVFDLRLIAIQ